MRSTVAPRAYRRRLSRRTVPHRRFERPRSPHLGLWALLLALVCSSPCVCAQATAPGTEPGDSLATPQHEAGDRMDHRDLPILLLEEIPSAADGDTLRLDPIGPRAAAFDPDAIRFWPVRLDTVFVRAERPTRAELLARRSSFAAWIPAAPTRAPGKDIGTWLAATAGVQVQRYGGPGATATVSIRGAQPGEVEVYLDRTPLRSASQGTVDLNLFDPSFLAGIEVHRSAAPSELPGSGAGSAVRLVTHPLGAGRAAFRYSGGSFGTREFSALTTGRLAQHAYLLSYARFATTGDFRYLNDNGTQHDASDDAWMRWTNGEVERHAWLGKLRFALPRATTLHWSSQVVQRDQGIPGTRGRPTLEARQETQNALHRIELASGPRWHPALRGHLFAYHESRRQHYRDPERELNLIGSPRNIEQTTRRTAGGFDLRWVTLSASPWIGSHTVELRGEYGRESLAREPEGARPHESDRQRVRHAFGVGNHWDTYADRLRLSLAYDWERAQDNYTGADPYRPFSEQAAHAATVAGARAGVRARLGAGHALKANIARQGRFPTFAELFGYEGTVSGNPELTPETGWRADAGWTWELARGPFGSRLLIEHVLYTTHLDDMIVFIHVNNRQTKPFNLDRTRIDGYELTLDWNALPGLRALPALLQLAPAGAGADATLALRLDWQDARDEGVSPIYHGRQLTYHPPLQARLALDLGCAGWRFAATSRYRAAAYWSRSNLEAFQTDAQWQHDLQLRWRIPRSELTLAARVENLTDARLEDIRGYPLPGRAWFAEVEWRLHESVSN